MMRRLLTALFVIAAIGTPVRAELKYTARMELRAAAVPSTTPPDPLMAMLGSLITDMMVPAGGMEITGVVGEKGARIEFSKAYLTIPAGAVGLVRPDGSMVLLNPADKTYWKAAASESVLPPGMTPTVTSRRTGEFAEIAGVRSERIAFSLRFAIPLPDGVQLPPGMPTELTMEGDMWTTDRFKASANATATAMTMTMGLKAVGLEKMLNGGMPMRTVLRSPLFAGKEMETVVLKIAEEAVPDGFFDVPADFREVPAPTGIGRMGGPRG
jgi:hypothetical protein